MAKSTKEETKHEEIEHLTGPLCKAISNTTMLLNCVFINNQFTFLGLSLRDLGLSNEKDKDTGYKGTTTLLEKCCFLVFWGLRLRDTTIMRKTKTLVQRNHNITLTICLTIHV